MTRIIVREAKGDHRETVHRSDAAARVMVGTILDQDRCDDENFACDDSIRIDRG
ncbi:hypothetical protein I3J27_07665 [Bradyrhizobium xenonodulans]|uniref:Uncharacterized protein n=1 Tax=Bradyrhizobium xenonodulans TaxID=2736875 RepID=A0ABY7MRN5_9BRAD|nr:hypothetical protein [Bradyrhizobium xenonodulans]WBL80291.1 hypothetical protein I3J27_07665 [Bradyrhizobium xenonodulans]